MHPITGSTNQIAMDEIARGVIEAVADRPADSQARRIARQRATAWSISSFQPSDPVQAMLAGQCVIFDHLLRDGAIDALRSQQQDIKLRARTQVLATGKMFLAHLEKFEELHNRLADQLAFRPVIEQSAVPGASSSAPRDDAASSPAKATPHPGPVEPAPIATAAATMEAAPMADTVTLPGVQAATGAEVEVGTPRMTIGQGTAAPAELPVMVQQDQTPPIIASAGQPVLRPAAVAQASSQSGVSASNGGAGTKQASPNTLPEQSKTPKSAALDVDGTQCNPASGKGRQNEALAMLAASLRVSPASGIAGQTSPAGQQRAATPSVKIDELV